MIEKKIEKPKIAIIGSYPPPYGGVSMHIQRLQINLLKNNIHSHVYNMSSSVCGAKNVFNMKKMINWLKIIFLKKDIYHIHTSGKNWIWLAFYFMLSKFIRAKFIITYHSLRYNNKDFSSFSRKVLKNIFNNTQHIIATNLKVKNTLITLGADETKISIIPAFLPPFNSVNSQNTLPEEINSFIKIHQQVISAYAYTLKDSSPILNGMGTTDMYGIDLLLDLCIILKRKYPKIGIVLCVTHLNDESALKKIRLKIHENHISDNILLYHKPIEGLYNLWLKSDIYVRPTLSDGDSVALREALLLETPSVASDSVLRPDGTVIFKSQDVNDFADKVNGIIENYSFYKTKLENLKMDNNYDKLLHIYQQVNN
jgi:glycosyltransferase involved in cell wall biosynthesis